MQKKKKKKKEEKKKNNKKSAAVSDIRHFKKYTQQFLIAKIKLIQFQSIHHCKRHLSRVSN